MKKLIILLAVILGMAACKKEDQCPKVAIESMDHRIEVILNDSHLIYLPPGHTYFYEECFVTKIVVRSKEKSYSVRIGGKVYNLTGGQDADIMDRKIK